MRQEESQESAVSGSQGKKVPSGEGVTGYVNALEGQGRDTLG